MTIEELTGGANGTPGRVVTLVGPSLPVMGAEWGGENKVITSWYNGNGDEATQSVLGPREMPSTWSGDWRRTMMGRTPAQLIGGTGGSAGFDLVRSPMVLAEALEAIFRSGSRLRVTWSVTSATGNPDEEGRIVRVGIAETWKFKVTRVTDIEWEIKFAWAGRGVQTQRVTNTRAGTVTTSSQSLNNAINKLIAQSIRAQFAKDNPRSLTLGQLEQLANAPTALVTKFTRKVQQISSEVTQVVNIASTLANQPAHITAAVANQAHNCVSQANNFRDQLDQIPIELQSNRSRVDSVLRAGSSFARQSQAAGDVAKAASDLGKQLQTQLIAVALTGALNPKRISGPGAVQAVYVAVDGDTPQRVSQKFYKSPDHAVDILRANRLPLHQPSFFPGKILVIPSLSPTGPGSAGGVGA